MKKIFYFLTCVAFTFLLSSCGNSAEEIAKKKKEDSLMEIDRNNSLENANKLFSQTDTIKCDSTKSK